MLAPAGAYAGVTLSAGDGITVDAPGIRHTAFNAPLVVQDTIVRDNLGTGIDIAADTSAVLERVRSERNSGDGFHMIAANTSANATIVDSTFAFNGGNRTLAYVGGNRLAALGPDFVKSNGAFFGSYRNNVGGFTSFGTISTAVGL